MRRRWKVALGIAVTPVLAVSVLGAAGQMRWDRTFEAPEPNLRASSDPDVIARGRYLAYGPAHCVQCHTKQEVWPQIDKGEEPPLSGGYAFALPLGTFYTANLTPDDETGIGRLTDGQLARALRHSVRRDGRAVLPFMEFQNMSDDDIVALISFLRAQPAVHNAVPAHAFTVLGKTMMALLIKPKGPDGEPPAHTPAEDTTVERGEYVANRVANCAGCHTKRNMLDGSYTGEKLAGGGMMPRESDPSQMFVTPNLTPDSATGHIYHWTEEQFIARFRVGRVYQDSHMPWSAFAKMSDTDLRAIYRYLRSLPPVSSPTGAVVQAVRD